MFNSSARIDQNDDPSAYGFEGVSDPAGRGTVDPALTLTARRDVLTAAQRRNLTETALYCAPLRVEDATELHAAYRHGWHPGYSTWRQEHLATPTRRLGIWAEPSRSASKPRPG